MVKSREDIINESDIVSIVSKYTDLEEAGRYFKGKSPFKKTNKLYPDIEVVLEKKQPESITFAVSPNQKRFYCFESGIDGDVVDFLCFIKNIPEPEAMLILRLENIKDSLEEQAAILEEEKRK